MANNLQENNGGNIPKPIEPGGTKGLTVSNVPEKPVKPVKPVKPPPPPPKK